MKLSTAEIYRQKESSPLAQTAKFIFSRLLNSCEVFELGHLLNGIKTGKTPSKNEKKFYEDEFIDWFKPNEIGDKKYLENAENKLSEFAYTKGQVTVYKANSILINAIGDVGRIAILKHKASSNQQITGIELDEEKILTEYCYYYLLVNRHHFYKDLFQTTLPIVNQKKIKLIPIPVPKIEEQKRIVAFLNKLENINSIDELHEIIGFDDFIGVAEKFYIIINKSSDLSTELIHQLDLVKQLRQAFLREAMQGKLVPQDPNDEPASVLLEKIKAEKERLIKEKKIRKQKPLPPITEEEIPFEIPENWVWCRLGDSGELKRGKSKHRPRNDEKLFKDGKYPFIQTGDVARSKSNGFIIETINGYYNDFGLAQSEMQPMGTLCITIAANIAECGFLGFDACAPDSIVCYNSHDKYNEKYVFYYLLDARDEIQKYAPATAQKNINLGILNSLIIPLPPLCEQQRIVTKLDELMQYCDELEASIKESQQHNDLLLQQVLREALEPDTSESIQKQEKAEV